MSKSRYRKRQTQPTAQPRRLSLLWIGGAVLAIIGLVVFVLANREPPYTPEVSGAPRAQVDQTALDHGDVRFETWVSSDFSVRNIGDQPLVILGEPRVEIVEGC
jgi:hypothetical protein